MAKRATRKSKRVEDYEHMEAKRLNNPPSGLAQYDTEKPPKLRFEYDPHLDPQLMWTGKAERQSFEVEAPSIHVHERLSTEAIIRSVQKEPAQPALFGDEGLDRSRAVEFYQHEQGWVNRLILGDSLVVSGSLAGSYPPPACTRGRPALTLPRTSQSSRLSGTVTVAEAKVLLPHASVTR